jgi:SAM-dependent methyltransferase
MPSVTKPLRAEPSAAGRRDERLRDAPTRPVFQRGGGLADRHGSHGDGTTDDRDAKEDGTSRVGLRLTQPWKGEMDEYDLIADWYASDRDPTIGVPEVTALASALPRGARVLDVGCGTGLPLTRTLLSLGCQVVAVDSSPRMLERFRVNCPDTPFVCGAIQSCDLGGIEFDAAIAWGVLFDQDEQAKAIARLAQALKAGGRLLFTSGDRDGSIQGLPMNGVPFRYWSFSVEGYRSLLEAHGIELEGTHADAGQNIYYGAVKRA